LVDSGNGTQYRHAHEYARGTVVCFRVDRAARVHRFRAGRAQRNSAMAAPHRRGARGGIGPWGRHGQNRQNDTDHRARKKIADIALNVINKAGGGGTIGWTYLSQHPRDGHYLAIGSPALLTNHITGKSTLSHADFTPLAMLISEYTAFAVASGSTIKTGKDLLERLRADPRSVSVAISISLLASAAAIMLQSAKSAKRPASTFRS
jgi:hypothetical protein